MKIIISKIRGKTKYKLIRKTSNKLSRKTFKIKIIIYENKTKKERKKNTNKNNKKLMNNFKLNKKKK